MKHWNKTISGAVMVLFTASLMLMLMCPSMVSASAAHHNCGAVVGMGAAPLAAALTALPTCLFPHVAAFRSLTFVVPDVSFLLFFALAIVAFLGAIFFASQYRQRLHWLLEQQFWQYKKYVANLFAPPRTKKFLLWLTRLRTSNFASC